MIIEKQTNGVVLEEGEEIQESIKMTIDLESLPELMEMFNEGFYGDAIGSLIRETC